MRLTLPRCDTDNHSVALRMRRLAVMARSSRLRGCWVVLGAVGLAGRSSRRQGQLAGTVPPPPAPSHHARRPAGAERGWAGNRPDDRTVTTTFTLHVFKTTPE